MFAAEPHQPYDVVELDPKHQPDVLLIEPFLEDRSPFAIYRRDTAPTPSGFAEIVSNYFPVLHARSIVSGTCIQSISNTVRRHDGNKAPRPVALLSEPSRHIAPILWSCSVVAAGLMVLGVIAGFDALFAAASCCYRIASSCCFRSASKFAFCSAEYALPFAAAAFLRPAQGGPVWTRLSLV
jgi:hypothetical protein